MVSVSSTTAELSWEPVTGATSYFVWIEPEVKGQKSPLKVSFAGTSKPLIVNFAKPKL